MDFDLIAILMGLIVKFPVLGMVLAALGALVVLGQAYIALTPSQDDDAWYAKVESIPYVGAILKALKAFAPIQRKEKF